MKLRRRRKIDTIPISAMGDIAFFFLFFYMATTMVTDQKPLDVELPRVDAPATQSPYPLNVYLNRDLASRNEVYFYNQAIPIDRLADAITDEAARAPSAVSVYLSIERDLPYRQMDRVIQALKLAGISNLIITTRTGASEPVPAP